MVLFAATVLRGEWQPFWTLRSPSTDPPELRLWISRLPLIPDIRLFIHRDRASQGSWGGSADAPQHVITDRGRGGVPRVRAGRSTSSGAEGGLKDQNVIRGASVCRDEGAASARHRGPGGFVGGVRWRQPRVLRRPGTRWSMELASK